MVERKFGRLAWERDRYDVLHSSTLETLALATESRLSWTAGIGGEYAFTNYPSGFLEYNYSDFGNRDVTFVTPSGEPSNTLDVKETKSVVKAGVNFMFGGGKAPIAARY
jgi:outer membrane immunogenic protein